MKSVIMNILPLLFLSITLAACSSNSSNTDQSSRPTPNASNIPGNTTMTTETELSQNGDPDGFRYQYVRDPKSGLIQYRSLLPKNWIIHQEPNAPNFITGSGGISVSQTKTENYAYSIDPYMLQSIQMSGQSVSPVYSLDQIIDQSIKPAVESQGYTFIDKFPMPEIESFWKKFSAGMLQTGSQREFYALGTEWKDKKGNHTLIMSTQLIIRKGQVINWILQTSELKAPPSLFEEAKKTYLYSLANTEINPQWQQYANGQLRGQIRQNDAFWAAKSKESAQAHQLRMAAIQARGNASQSIANTYSDISDISHSGYLKRSDINSSGHSKSMDMIGERVVIGNPETSERYIVPSGSNYYWVNKNGEYISTDNSLYDPRIDNRINESEWSKFEVEK